jgi:hypothetical protein
MRDIGLFYCLDSDSPQKDWNRFFELVAICDTNNRLAVSSRGKATLGAIIKETIN